MSLIKKIVNKLLGRREEKPKNDASIYPMF
jgi:hypothetical protein